MQGTECRRTWSLLLRKPSLRSGPAGERGLVRQTGDLLPDRTSELGFPGETGDADFCHGNGSGLSVGHAERTASMRSVQMPPE